MFTILTGAQFGDEGKGKIIDLLAENYDIIARFQGGDNAGHTVVVAGKKYKLHLVPSGAIFGRRLLIGPGVVLNPRVLWNEIQTLESEGIRVDLGIDPNVACVRRQGWRRSAPQTAALDSPMWTRSLARRSRWEI